VRGELVSIWVGERKVKVPTSRKGREKWGTQPVSISKETPRKRIHRAGMDISWLTERIAVGGGIWNPENMAKVAAARITHIIDMQIEFDDTPLARPFGIEVLWNPTDDDFEVKPASLFRRGVEFTERALMSDDSKIFIHCAAGIHRAPMMALAVLGSMGWSLEDAMELIEARRPVADLAEVYVESVERFLDGE
jgi:protein-tyrosine phosphatase